MFLVETDDLDQARRDGGEFAGAIAKIDTSKSAKPVPTDFVQHTTGIVRLFCYGIALIMMLAPACAVGGLSSFRFVKPDNMMQ